MTAPECPHGYELESRTRTGEARCPMCRRQAKSLRRAQAARTAKYQQPRLDVAALRAGDDSLTDRDDPQVINLASRRARRRETNH